MQRVVFHEITDGAVKEAFAHPRDLDDNLIDAQQARRVPTDWSATSSAPFCGRRCGADCQPAGCSRWRAAHRRAGAGDRGIPDGRVLEHRGKLAPKLKNGADAQTFTAGLQRLQGSKARIEIKNEAEASAITGDLEGATYRVTSVQRRERRTRPSAPVHHQHPPAGGLAEAPIHRAETMVVAQQLYEGVNVGTGGTTGLIST